MFCYLIGISEDASLKLGEINAFKIGAFFFCLWHSRKGTNFVKIERRKVSWGRGCDSYSEDRELFPGLLCISGDCDI